MIDVIKIIEYLKKYSELENKEINIDYLEENIDSFSIHIENPETEENIIKKFVDGKCIYKAYIILMKLSSYSKDEAVENNEFYINFVNWIKKQNKDYTFPDIEGVMSIKVISENYIVEEKSTEAIYEIKIEIKYEGEI